MRTHRISVSLNYNSAHGRVSVARIPRLAYHSHGNKSNRILFGKKFVVFFNRHQSLRMRILDHATWFYLLFSKQLKMSLLWPWFDLEYELQAAAIVIYNIVCAHQIIKALSPFRHRSEVRLRKRNSSLSDRFILGCETAKLWPFILNEIYLSNFSCECGAH